ncbi:conserved hypothetical protein [Theileria equi strain WA]|uniref:Serine aminopeptidase S33 domain-containing protein n=1 Tax=Theileria equi strain WA TaxID=1537102 RepID=L1LBD0_THEEQ|nr:conserved hypothetical protein [Theileria equi strain WA]EKX72737.1 conserved hypothetical protein [Theileria equi strain WA]|eukprot:XP_004832189.1 conserved hypothetical protein [Theileria equi strain WA]
MPFLWVLFLFIRPTLAGYEEETKDTILDVTTSDSSFIDTFTRNPCGINTKIHVARDGYKILSVWDGQSLLWKSSNGYSCDHVAVVRCREKSSRSTSFVTRLVAVYASNSNGIKKPFYYEKDESSWKTVEEEKFYRSFHHEALKMSILKSLVLNITGENKSPEFLSSSPDFPSSAYAPNVGYRIKKVIYKTALGHRNNRIHVVWSRSSKDEHCIYASFFPKKDPKVGYLIIEGKDGLQEKFYAKSGIFGRWNTKTKEDYLTRLKKAGFNESTFNNHITMDISNVDGNNFYIKKYPINSYGVNSYIPSLGLKLKSITEGNVDIWKVEEGSTAKCINVNVVYRDAVFCALFLLVEDPANDRHVLYFVKNDKEWKNVSKDEYYDHIAKENGLEPLGKIENPKVIMSSFRNKDDLKIVTYSSGVENSKGDVILVHGIRSHFKSEFCASSTEWNFEHFGFPIFPDISGIFMQGNAQKTNYTAMYKYLFEHARLDGMDAFEASPRYEYSQSLTAFFNGLGYSVYGLDLQSHGLSESFSPTRCHAREFINFALDLLQFISIVKRSKFEDSSEKWNEEVVYENIPMDRKVFLLGNSMGGNIVFQAVQEFYKHAKEEARFVDGLISIAGMFSLDHHADTTTKKVAKHLLGAVARAAPKTENLYDKLLNYGEFFELFTRYRDPFFYAKRLTLETANALLNACNDVKKPKNLANYPKDLPTLFLHTDNDFLCDPKGPREMVNIHLKDHSDVKLVEFKASTHFLTVPHSIVLTQKAFKEWLSKHTPSATNANTVDKTNNVGKMK